MESLWKIKKSKTMITKICLWSVRTSYWRGFKAFAALCEFDLENDKVCVVSKIINPYSKGGDYSQEFKEFMNKHNVSENEILLAFPESALKTLQTAKKVKELSKDLELPNFIKQRLNKL